MKTKAANDVKHKGRHGECLPNVTPRPAHPKQQVTTRETAVVMCKFLQKDTQIKQKLTFASVACDIKRCTIQKETKLQGSCI